MKALKLAPALLLLAFAAPALAQGIPDYIPDEPGEPLIDRQKERWQEQYRSTLSRFYAMGSMDVAPVTGDGFGYQANVNVGYRLDSGDAVFVSFAARDTPIRFTDDIGQPQAWTPVTYAGAGYELAGTRFFGESDLGYRTGLSMAMGLLVSEAYAVAFDVAPTYDLLQKNNFSVPVGVRLSVVATGMDEVRTNRAFLGFDIGVRYFWVNHGRMD